jgi:hypothetical protein
MRKYIIALGIGLAAVLITLYLLRTLPPLDSETVQEIVATERVVSEEELLAAIDRLGATGQLTPFLNWRNLGLILATGFIAAAALVTFLHLILAKLTTGPFGRQPKVSTAVRRGIELGIIGVLLIIFRLSIADTYLYILTPVFALFVEYLLSQPSKKELEELYGNQMTASGTELANNGFITDKSPAVEENTDIVDTAFEAQETPEVLTTQENADD